MFLGGGGNVKGVMKILVVVKMSWLNLGLEIMLRQRKATEEWW